MKAGRKEGREEESEGEREEGRDEEEGKRKVREDVGWRGVSFRGVFYSSC